MMLRFEGPWKLGNLTDNPISPFPDEMGNYLVSVPPDVYGAGRHGSSRFIYIGGMGSSDNASLSKRLGEFIAATFGFMTYHSGGKCFFAERHNHGINPWHLEFWWCCYDDPKCCEVQLFDEYTHDFGSLPLLNKQRQWTGCQAKLHSMALHVPWR